MSRETLEWLRTNTLIGYVDELGAAWHADDVRNNHYPGPIPLEAVHRLLDWRAEEREVYVYPSPDSLPQVVTGRKAIYRPDTETVFSVVGSGYTIHQFQDELVDAVAAILDVSAGDLGIGSVVLLKGGAVCSVQIRPPEGVTIGGERLLPWLTGYSSHDSTFATTYKGGSTRVQCDNTLAMFALEGEPEIRVRHTRNSKLLLAEARQALDVVFASFDAFSQEAERLMDTAITDDQFRKIVDTVIGPAPTDASQRSLTMRGDRIAQLVGLWEHDTSGLLGTARGSAWGAVQTFNTVNQHYATIRGATRPERTAMRFLQGGTFAEDRKVLATVRKVLAA